VWLKPGLPLPEQGVTDPKEVLLLKKRYFASDDKVDTSDPVQLHVLYAQVINIFFFIVKILHLVTTTTTTTTTTTIRIQVFFDWIVFGCGVERKFACH
jgi:hypothetical protein